MQLSVKKYDFGGGVSGLYIKTDKFKTRRVSVTFILPVTEKKSACASMLSRLLVRSGKQYPEHVLLNRRLSELYGAFVGGSISKSGDCQLLTLSAASLSDRYSADEKTSLTGRVDELFLSLLFEPKFENSAFCSEDFEIERRLLIEDLLGAINDKRTYAINKMYEIMCEGEPFGIKDSGGIETVKAVTPQEVYDYYNEVLKTAGIRITVTGGGEDDNDAFFERFNGKLAEIKRTYEKISDDVFIENAKEVKYREEALSVSQGKLVMGLRAGVSSTICDIAPYSVMTDILGGSPYSLLFTNVREKQSLCYYCAARFAQKKGIICIDSGIEFENFEAAKKGISEQIETLKAGNFDDSLLDASHIGLSDSLFSVCDSPSSLERWYIIRMFDKEQLSPIEFAQKVQKVTREQVVAAANSISLDTIYFLKGED